MDEVKLIQVIVTRLLRRGNGKDDPIRIITQYWSLDGELLAEVDPNKELFRCQIKEHGQRLKSE